MNYIATIISNLSNGYIHFYWTGPPTFTSNGKCTGRCMLGKLFYWTFPDITFTHFHCIHNHIPVRITVLISNFMHVAST